MRMPAWTRSNAAEMFIIPLDNRREWYRYHHLFQELLQHRLNAEAGPDLVANLHLPGVDLVRAAWTAG